MESDLRDAVAERLDVRVAGARPLGGGDFARSYRVELADGRTVFAKTHADPPPGFFVTEAAGLAWLREAGVLAVPEVLAVGEALLVLEWVDEAVDEGSSRPDERAFGEALAALHRSGAPVFGREDRRPTGSRSLPNDPAVSWARFYSERRLRPLVEMAHGAVQEKTLQVIEHLDLESFGAADEPPARLHGDLWAGNRLVDGRGVSWLIDPAAHGGHREFDLAMMRLFGGFGPAAFEAYDEVFPLQAGWERRVALHQLAPLLVHAVKFGGHYPSAVDRAVASLR